MKTTKNLFHEIVSLQNLYDSYKTVSKGKRNTSAYIKFTNDLANNILNLFNELLDGSYEPSKYRIFWVQDPKPRKIIAPAFRDRIVQQAIYNFIYPIYDKTFINTNFACRYGLGTRVCSEYVQNSLGLYNGDMYYLQLDIKSFFKSIDHSILLDLLKRRISDERTLDLMSKFIPPQFEGVPIGNLLSQLYSLVYLNPLDHFIKRQIKVKHYARYMDDFILIGLTLDQANYYKEIIEEFLQSVLKLTLSKWRIDKLKHGVDFVGFRTYKDRKFVRRRIIRKFIHAVKTGSTDVYVSLYGHSLRTNSSKFLMELFWNLIV